MSKAKNQTSNLVQQIRKTIGNTTYEVIVHFSQTSNESVHDKLRRIIINDYINRKELNK